MGRRPMPRNTGRKSEISKSKERDRHLAAFGNPLYKQGNRYCSFFFIIVFGALTAFSPFAWVPLGLIMFQWLVFLVFWTDHPKEQPNLIEPPENWDELTWDERIWLNEQMIIAGYENGFVGMPHVDDFGNPYGPRYREIRPVKDRAMTQAYVNGIEVPRLLIGDWARLTHDSRMLVADQNFNTKEDLGGLILDEQDRQLELKEKVARERRQIACAHLYWIDVTSVSDDRQRWVCEDCGLLTDDHNEIEASKIIMKGKGGRKYAFPPEGPSNNPRRGETDWSEAWGQEHADMVRQHRYAAPETTCFCEGCQTRENKGRRK
jgi:hypothetical protein